VVAISTNAKKRTAALEMGADEFVDSKVKKNVQKTFK
jgi:hypothetical protein